MQLDRAIKICVWAAKCHAHSQQSQMPLGRLPHTASEVQEAIRSVEAHMTHYALTCQPKKKPVRLI